MDLRSSGASVRVRRMTRQDPSCAVVPQDPQIEVAAEEYREARQAIVDYILRTARQRAQVVASGNVTQIVSVLSAEMGLAGALGQIDTVRTLGETADRVIHAEANLVVSELRDYRARFDQGIDPALDGILRDT